MSDHEDNSDDSGERDGVSRRDMLKLGTLGAAGLALSGGLAAAARDGVSGSEGGSGGQGRGPQMDGMGTVGSVDHAANGFSPEELLYEYDYGETSQLADGRTLREYRIEAVDREIEIAPGLNFPAWTYEGRVPGPTLRCTEGDRIRIEFVNHGSHPHTIHFHGIHPASMDGVPGVGAGVIKPGESTVYEFDAEPFGCHLYHCHSSPLKRHIHKGLYGGFIVDPDPESFDDPEKVQRARSLNHDFPEDSEVNEMVMVMNSFDTDFDGENEIYAVNTVANEFVDNPIRIRSDRTQRIYLINVTEFDPVNSFHLHANFFDYYDHGTTLEPTKETVDTIMQCQAQRGIIEFDFAGFEPGLYMFHAHQSEFAELGWMGFFEVVEGGEGGE